MLRLLRPPAAPSGPPPTFDRPGDVLAWAHQLTFLDTGSWALHLDAGRRLTCVALREHQSWSGAAWDSDLLGDGVAECGAAWVVVLIGKRRPKTVTDTDRRAHLKLWASLARNGVNLLDTVLAWPDGGASVTATGSYAEVAGIGDERALAVHVPARQPRPPWEERPDHVPAGAGGAIPPPVDPWDDERCLVAVPDVDRGAAWDTAVLSDEPPFPFDDERGGDWWR